MYVGIQIFVFISALCLDFVMLLNNGLARTPPMGWMSWGYYQCADDCDKNSDKCLNEQLIMSVADALFNDGYLEAGYEYVVIDDCWSERQRDSNDRLVPDRKRFPRGMKFLADYVHKLGLKFGMYTNVGKDTCMHYPGSRDHFETDAQQFAEWDVDYLKVDGCFVEDKHLDTAYIKLGHYLNKTGRPMVFSCSWPYYKEYIHKTKFNYAPIAKHCNMWRNFHDIFINFGNVVWIIDNYEKNNRLYRQFHKPGQWNDPDMIILGNNGLTESQSRIQMGLWSMWSAPLLLSCDMTKIKPYEKQLLQNMDLLAIAQDPRGKMAAAFKIRDKVTLWVKRHLPMKGDLYSSFSFALVNLNGDNQYVSFKPAEYGLEATDVYTILDVFTGVFLRNVTRQEVLNISVPPEDIILYAFYPL
ncbi:alpha-N-acetylgalactosaminidase-like [Cydia amplana]|uniref:alpha-N-acetylgalactosaminidase-like n=1 Tax=Cydia amplana TaxID=1869771 RepID=UPI002FE6660C